MQNSKRKIREFILITLLLVGIVIVGLLVHSKPSNNPCFFEEGPQSKEKQDISVSESVIEKVLLEKVPELCAYEEYIQKESNGQAGLCIQIYEAMEITGDSLLKEGKYYPIYVGEGWETYNVNWDWFYISQDLETIYWYDIVEGVFHSLEEWRISDKYRKLMGNELGQDIQEVKDMLTKEEALQLVFDYEYASWENLVDVTCYETDDVVGYKWLTENDMRYPMYLTVSEIVTTSQGNTYGIVRLAKDIYSTSGVYFRTETYNEFAVNMDTGEIIEMRVYLDEGGWEYSEEYRKKVLGDK